MWRLRDMRRKAPELDYVMELSDRLAGIEEGVAMANYRGARNEILLLCMKAAMPPEKEKWLIKCWQQLSRSTPMCIFPQRVWWTSPRFLHLIRRLTKLLLLLEKDRFRVLGPTQEPSPTKLTPQ
ncbi:hypothetical protein PIB30_075746 [Stylosanthes scabra]|uniref:Uncharacterized protein n=1 Tax=Stylosanthes scabra TaxID=79078 RepID=A0ABU6VRY2_9FABA|nr:hypothetical protein [Stylosanthes scabra]